MKRAALFAVAFVVLTPLAHAQSMLTVFPQVADGVFSDGSYYKTTLTILPWFETSPPTTTCALVLYGLGVNFNKGISSNWNIGVSAGSYFAATSAADQPLRQGYATLTCSNLVYAQALYSYYSKDGTKIAETTVFGLNGDFDLNTSYRMIADQRGSQLAIAIANNTDLPRTYQLTINSLGATVTVPARTSTAKFLTDIFPATANTIGMLTIQSPDFSDFYAIGLRFTGAVFTTIPANQ
jgi:hypothetical protein